MTELEILERAKLYTLIMINDEENKNTLEFMRENGLNNIHSRLVEQYIKEYREIKRKIKELENTNNK